MPTVLLLAPLFLLFELWQLVLGERYLGVKQIARGIDPRTLGLGEMTAFCWSAMLILQWIWMLLLLTHLVIFAPLSSRLKTGLIVGSFGSALVMEGGSWLVRFVDPAFAWLKLAAFLVFQTLLAALILGLGVFLARGRRTPTAR